MNSKQKIVYPSPRDLKAILLDNANRTDIKAFLRRKGIFFFNATPDDMMSSVSEIIFGYNDLQIIRSYVYRASNKQILSGFTLTSDKMFDLTSIYNSVRKNGKTKTDGYELKSICQKKMASGDTYYEGSMVYTKKTAGRIEFLRTEERDVSFIMKKVDDRNWQVEVDGSQSADGKSVIQMLENITKDHQVKITLLLLDYLSRSESITFFDRLSHEGLGSEWKLEDIGRITLKKHAGTYDDKEEDADEEDEEASVEQLSGISQAILEGKNLRENKFVKQAEDSGYAFTSMTYVFAGKAKKIKLRAEFKRNPKIFEVCLENYMEPAIGEKEKYEDAMSSLDEADNIAIRSVFWNNAKKVFKSIQDERLKSQTMVTSRKK